MNYNLMSDVELIHYLDLYATDPLVRRLANMLHNTRGALVSDLENAGMNPDTWMFETDWQNMYPGDYIQKLRGDVERLESDLDYTKEQLEDSERERNELKTRSIMDFVEEVWQEKRAATYKVQQAMEKSRRVDEENAKLREKLEMWGHLNYVSKGE